MSRHSRDSLAERINQVNQIMMPPNNSHREAGRAPLAPNSRTAIGRKMSKQHSRQHQSHNYHQQQQHTSKSRLDTQSQSHFGHLPSLLGSGTSTKQAAAASSLLYDAGSTSKNGPGENLASFKTHAIPMKKSSV